MKKSPIAYLVSRPQPLNADPSILLLLVDVGQSLDVVLTSFVDNVGEGLGRITAGGHLRFDEHAHVLRGDRVAGAVAFLVKLVKPDGRAGVENEGAIDTVVADQKFWKSHADTMRRGSRTDQRFSDQPPQARRSDPSASEALHQLRQLRPLLNF